MTSPFIIFLENATSNSERQYTIPDGGRIEIQCLTNNTNATITWKIFGEPLSGDLSNFNISENSTLIVTNPRNSSLQGLVNVTCIIASSNNTNFSRIIEVVFFKGNNFAPRLIKMMSGNLTTMLVSGLIIQG